MLFRSLNKIITTAIPLGIIFTISPSRAFAETSFDELGGLDPSGSQDTTPFAISADGHFVGGVSNAELGQEGFRWSQETGMLPLHDLPGGLSGNPQATVYGLSASGSIAVGTGWTELLHPQKGIVSVARAVLWPGAGQEPIELPSEAPDPTPCTQPNTGAHGISNDSNTIVGYARVVSSTKCTSRAVVWRSRSAVAQLLPTPENFESSAKSCSADGTVIVGYVYDDKGATLAAVWDSNGLHLLSPISGPNGFSVAEAVSADGKTVVGITTTAAASVGEPFIWTEQNGMEPLGTLSGAVGGGRAYDVSADGNVVVGATTVPGGSPCYVGQSSCRAFIWTKEQGMRDLESVLVSDYGLASKLINRDLMYALAVSDDGRTITGNSRHFGSSGGFNVEAWRAQLNTTDMVDPIPDLLDGTKISQNATLLATKGRRVSGVSADGVSQIVVRYGLLGSSFMGADVELLDEDGIVSSSTPEHGAIAPIEINSFSSQASQIYVDPKTTSAGNVIFVVYRAPTDFVRQNRSAKDIPATSRKVKLRFTFDDGTKDTVEIAVVRPPVALIHGTFSTPAVWDSARALVDNPRFYFTRLDYSQDVDNLVGETQPEYQAHRTKHHVSRNVIGIDYNAPLLLEDLTQVEGNPLSEFRTGAGTPTGLSVAAVQFDVVAHSLGGLMARGMTRHKEFFIPDNFDRGYFHKLITLGSTHLGTHHSLRLMSGQNNCSRDLSARTGAYNFESLIIARKRHNGAVFDQVGDGTIVNASQKIKDLHLPLPVRADGSSPPPLPTAYIASRWGQRNEATTVNIFGMAADIACDDFIGEHFSTSQWNAIFDWQDNDVIVPLRSAADGQSVYTLLEGVVHGPGSVGAGDYLHGNPNVGFRGPHLLEDASGAPQRVVELLDEPLSSAQFVRIR